MDWGDAAKFAGSVAINPLLGPQALLAEKGLEKAGNAMGDNAASQVPEFHAPELDANTAAMQAQQREHANQSVEDIAGQHMAGTQAAGGLLPQYSNGDDSLKTALNRRTQKHFQGDLNKMQSQAETKAYAEKSKRLNAVAQTENQMNQWQHGIQMQQYQVDQAKKQARNQAMQSIFGTAGTLGGALMGGASGAGVGGSAGKMFAPAAAE